MHWTYLNLEGITIMTVLKQVAITRAVQMPGMWVRKWVTNLRSSRRRMSSSLSMLVRFKDEKKQHQQCHTARNFKRLESAEMEVDVFALSWHTSI